MGAARVEALSRIVLLSHDAFVALSSGDQHKQRQQCQVSHGVASLPIELHGVGGIGRAVTHKATPSFACFLGRCRLTGKLQGDGAILSDLQLLRLDRLLGLQGQQLVGGLGSLQGATRGLALLHQRRQGAFILRQVLCHLSLHAQRRMQPLEALLPALPRFFCQALAADVAGVLVRIDSANALAKISRPVRSASAKDNMGIQ